MSSGPGPCKKLGTWNCAHHMAQGRQSGSVNPVPEVPLLPFVLAMTLSQPWGGKQQGIWDHIQVSQNTHYTIRSQHWSNLFYNNANILEICNWEFNSSQHIRTFISLFYWLQVGGGKFFQDTTIAHFQVFRFILCNSLMQPQRSPTFKLQQGSNRKLSKVGVIRDLEFDMVTSIVFNILKTS